MEHYREREEGRTTTSFWVRTKTSLEIQKQVNINHMEITMKVLFLRCNNVGYSIKFNHVAVFTNAT